MAITTEIKGKQLIITADLETHTPGPWKQDLQHLDKGVLGKERVTRLIITEEPSWETICEMRWDAQEASFGHMIANARLIAAAPALLAALSGCVTAYEVHRDGQTTGALWPDPNHIVHARAAIAQVEKGATDADVPR